MPASILILTRNESVNITKCISHVQWSDDIVVFDSFSSDGTQDLARSMGARVIERKFENYARQRQAALSESGFKHAWVLMIDADETPDKHLIAEIQKLSCDRNPVNGYRVRRKDHFHSVWIRHCTLYPTWFLRFFRHDKVIFEDRPVHEHASIIGKTENLQGHLLHDNFSKGLADWRKRHEHYAELEANSLYNNHDSGISITDALFCRDPIRRRRAIKKLAYHLPMRHDLRFLYMMIMRGGVLDGKPGWEYARLIRWYDQLISKKYSEIKLHAQSQSIRSIRNNSQ